ncbi:sensor histidine kinase [Spirosoma linguale]|uniref:Signal transduction histidine kinase, LytS n=1 Tax=Spirosoma linguale (strain ATCC 33905 / DSM 74 / LMG 10896 / Claus 1) TaxID=504472 RepID=D2QEL0_SPILD|nr:signal transduction histidine kinase, LytS [Spirosoma linguale DSM 74]
MNNRFSQIAIHLLGCLTFLALPYVFADDGFARLAELPYNPHEQRTQVSYLLTIGFFYVNYYVLIPRLYFARRYVLYAVASVGCFLLIESTLAAINRRAYRPPVRPSFSAPPPNAAYRHEGIQGTYPPSLPPPGQRQPGLPSELAQTFFLTLAGFLMALALRVNSRWRETEQEKIQTELSYLKAQINPHFLFNTLNSIYSLAIIESPQTAAALVELSSFLRYVIQESQKNRVSVHNELDYIRQYIALQRLRLGDTAQIEFTVEGSPGSQQIAPLLLISFIENAFKYGVSPEEPSTIRIGIRLEEQAIHCHVFNKKVRIFQPTAVASGIGLTNTKARLQLLYPTHHQLRINDLADRFTVDLSITLS